MHERVPAVATARDHPDLAVARERWHEAPEDLTRRSWLEGVAKRASEGDQPLEFGYERSPLLRFGGSGRSQYLGSTPLTILMETEGRREETQARHHRKVWSGTSHVDDERPYGRPEHDDGAGDESDRPRGAMATERTHGNPRLEQGPTRSAEAQAYRFISASCEAGFSVPQRLILP